ncbi:c-type heme family protein [Thermodesulfatator atlanticus]
MVSILRQSWLILFLLPLFLSTCLFYYSYHREKIIERANKETEIFIATAEATRSYVKEVLRPKMYKIFHDERFIPEAMSTSHIGREIMRRIGKNFPYMEYKRAALNPRNPINRADDLEKNVIEEVKALKEKEVTRLLNRKGTLYFARFKAIYAEKSCLKCHGRPEDAPKDLLKLYGKSGGFNYRPGDIVAVDAVYIPVGPAISNLKKQVISTFLIGLIVLIFIVFSLRLLIHYEFLPHLRKLSFYLRSIIPGREAESPSPEEDNIEKMAASLEDLAIEVKRIHTELKKSEQKYRSLFESSQDAILMWNQERKLVDINPSGLKLFGFLDKSEALQIETIEQLFWDHQEALELLEKLEREGQIKEFETTVVDRGGNRYQILITASKAIDLGGLVLYEGIFRDITEKKLMEKHIITTEKLAAVGQLAAGLAHEINNSLSVIKCYANLLTKVNNLDEQAQKDLEIIKKHVKLSQDILQNLLNFSRPAEYKKAYVNVNEIIEEVVSVFASRFKKRSISLVLDLSPEAPALFLDRDKIKQVFMNMILNAVQAIERDGLIEIKTIFNKARQEVVIKIRDTGSGIPETIIDKIFDPFFTTKAPGEGTGLGLSVSYGIVKDHDGKIFVESKVGEGTTFTIVFPVNES